MKYNIIRIYIKNMPVKKVSDFQKSVKTEGENESS